jgi:rsbT co-antagonist protein RsbR
MQHCLADVTWTVTKLIDKLGLYTVEISAQSRNEMIKRQADELLELSTPAVELWEKNRSPPADWYAR